MFPVYTFAAGKGYCQNEYSATNGMDKESLYEKD